MFTRRTLLKSTTLSAVSSLLTRRSFATALPSLQPTPLAQLDYAAVTLLPGPALEQFQQNHRFFLALDNDMLLKPYRERAGLPAPGEDMGGWYSNTPLFDPHGLFDGYVPGHSFGQYLSGLARAFAITGDPATQRKVQQLVAGLEPTLLPRFYDDYTLPAYTFDKLCCGLSDAYALARVPSAMPALEVALQAALPHLPEKGTLPARNARPASQARVRHLGRVLHPSRKSLSRLAALRQPPLPRHRHPLSRRRPPTSTRSPKTSTSSPASTPTRT